MRKFILSLVCTTAGLLGSCSDDREGPHYQGEKTFGRTGTGDSLDSQPAEEPLIILPPDTKPPATGNRDEGKPDPSPKVPRPKPKPKPKPKPPVPDQPDVPTPPVQDDDEGEDQVTPPDTVIENSRYHALFDRESAQGIRDGSGLRSLGMAGNSVRENLNTLSDDGMQVTQTYGDGIARSTGAQRIRLAALDATRTEGAKTTSGQQVLDRVAGNGCPAPFFCVERLQNIPDEGAAMTLCFYDQGTGQRTLFPYAILPNYDQRDVTPWLGSYGPWMITVTDQADAACSETADPALPAEIVQTEVSVFDPSSAALPWPPEYAADFGVTFTTRRLSGEFSSPYLDETTGINHATTYLVDEQKNAAVKMIITTRQSVDIAASAGGGLIGRLAALLINLDGVQAELHFDICTGNPDQGDACIRSEASGL